MQQRSSLQDRRENPVVVYISSPKHYPAFLPPLLSRLVLIPRFLFHLPPLALTGL